MLKTNNQPDRFNMFNEINDIACIPNLMEYHIKHDMITSHRSDVLYYLKRLPNWFKYMIIIITARGEIPQFARNRTKPAEGHNLIPNS